MGLLYGACKQQNNHGETDNSIHKAANTKLTSQYGYRDMDEAKFHEGINKVNILTITVCIPVSLLIGVVKLFSRLS